MATKKTYAVIAALITWFAVIAQLVLIIQNRVVSLPETLLRFFSFFTILTNIIVAVCFTAEAGAGSSFWKKVSTQTAVAVYIMVVGIVYNVVLRQLWMPQGMQRIVDELLHLVVPLLFLFFWIMFVTKEKLSWKKSITWLLYPFIYLVFILIAGSISDYYPYPFVDVATHGYEKVLINCVFVLLLFVMLSLVFIGLSRYLSQKKSTQIA
jgi:hypothetical protein